MSTTSADRCGFQLDLGLADDVLASEPCRRPVWEDYDRCVWHAKVVGKTRETLQGSGPGPDASLEGAYLREAELVDVDWFVGASLVGADFTDARVNGSDFAEANLMLAKLAGMSGIGADFGGANLEGAIFTNADLRRATLESARLEGAVLTDVHVGSGTEFGETSIYEREGIRSVLGDTRPLAAAAWSYRQLQGIYRDNALPNLARRSYTREKEARRRLAWKDDDYLEAIKWELSRWVMFYGSSPYRILAVAAIVIAVCAVLFPLTGGIQETRGEQVITYALDDPTEAPRWWIAEVLFKSFYFSVVTFATLGYGDIQPIGTWARLLVGIETVLGTLLTALLVVVLARLVTW